MYKVSRRVLQKWKNFWKYLCQWQFWDFGDTRDKADISTGAKKAQKFKDHRNCTGIRFSKRFVLSTWKFHYLLNKLHEVQNPVDLIGLYSRGILLSGDTQRALFVICLRHHHSLQGTLLGLSPKYIFLQYWLPRVKNRRSKFQVSECWIEDSGLDQFK